MKLKHLSLILLIGINYLSFAQTPINDPHWQLIFSDYFATIDPSVWEIKDDFSHGDLALYMAYNIYKVNNKLNLRVKTENPCLTHTGELPGCYNYSGGWIQSRCPFDYGYFEAKIAFPYGISFHPAFWTFVTYGCHYKEIDIVEPMDGKGDSPGGYTWSKYDYSTGYFFCGPPTCYHHGQRLNGYDHTQSHIYGLEWTPNTLIWYIDNIPIRTAPYRSDGTLDQKLKLIFGFGLDPSFPPNGSTPFPSNIVIDYVKVYRLKTACSTSINICNYNFYNQDNYVRNQITIGGGGCINNVPSGLNVVLRASQKISINGQFDIPLGTSFFAEIDPCQDCVPCSYNPTCTPQ